MRIIQVSKDITVDLHGDKPAVTIAAEDHLCLDPAGIEFECRAEGTRRFIPWSEISEMHQPLD